MPLPVSDHANMHALYDLKVRGASHSEDDAIMSSEQAPSPPAFPKALIDDYPIRVLMFLPMIHRWD